MIVTLFQGHSEARLWPRSRIVACTDQNSCADGLAGTGCDVLLGARVVMGDRSEKHRFSVAVGPAFRAYIDDAIRRFSYLHPSVEIEVGAEAVTLFVDANVDLADLVRDFQFALYRQKIFTETLPLRKTLIEGVMGR